MPDQQIRLYVEGAFCAGCSSVLTEALADGGLTAHTKVAPNAGKGYVIVSGKFGHDSNLSSLAKLLNDASTPHREQAKPGVMLELFAKLTEADQKKVAAALADIPGVDAEGSKVDAKRGVISVRMTGEGKLTANGLIAQLKKAGIAAEIQSDRVKRVIGKETES